MADLTLAIAGHADNTEANIEALISDWLRLGAPDSEGFYAKPERYNKIVFYVLLTDGQVPPGLKPAMRMLWDISGTALEIVTDKVSGEIVKWAREADAIHEADDPAAKLISLLSGARSSRLLINWNESDADDENLIAMAHASEAGIKVLDLVEGLVEIAPDEPEPAPEPEPEVVRPRRARKAPEELEEVREELEETASPDEKPEEPSLVSTPSGPQAAEAAQTTMPIASQYVLPRDLAEEIYGLLAVTGDYHLYMDYMDTLRSGRAVQPPQKSPLTQQISDAAEKLRQILFGEEAYSTAATAAVNPKKTYGKATKVFWDDEKKEWEKIGRGRPRAGVRTGMMDVAGNVVEHK